MLGDFSMWTPKDIAEAMEKIPFEDMNMDVGADAMSDLWDRVASETGLSEEAVRQLMNEGYLLLMEMRQFGEGMHSGKVVPLAIYERR
jgi:hypothetical protein